MIDWEEKLNKFMETWEYKEDTTGILVCGSYITGNPSSRSDLDVHIVLVNHADYRERGNKIVDGLLIEYFANPPVQIRAYFKEDYNDISTMSLVQFITGKIMSDKNGDVQKLKDEAAALFDKNFADIPSGINKLNKYGIWDMRDDLLDAYENSRIDFDFLYYNNLNRLISEYMRFIKRPYHMKIILGNISDEAVRKKYLLKVLPDAEIADLIYMCITKAEKHERLECYTELTDYILSAMGGFNIDGFKFKSGLGL